MNYNYVPEEVAPEGTEFLALRADRLRAKMWRIHGTRFGTAYRDALAGASNVDVLLRRVFGIDDLYVAGSSVFPTGGAANPTLTIVALTLRLADHLADRLT